MSGDCWPMAGHHAGGEIIEAEFGARVADVLDDFAHELRDFDVSFGGDFAADEDEAGGEKGFARHARVRCRIR